MAGGVKDVERIEIHGDPATPCALRVADLHPSLKLGKAGSIPFERHDLAIHDEVICTRFRECFLELRILRVQHEAIA